MPAFKITYSLEGKCVYEETVFMKSLLYAKQSATRQSPQIIIDISICDLIDTILAERKMGVWSGPST